MESLTIDHVGVYASDPDGLRDEMQFQLGHQLTWHLDVEGLDNWWVGWGADVTMHIMPWHYPHEVAYVDRMGVVVNHTAFYSGDIEPACRAFEAAGRPLLFREEVGGEIVALYLGLDNEIIELIAMPDSLIDPPAEATIVADGFPAPQYVNIVSRDVDASVALMKSTVGMTEVGRSASGETAYMADGRLDTDRHAFVVRYVGGGDWNNRERDWIDTKGPGMQAMGYRAADHAKAMAAAEKRGMKAGGPDWLITNDGHELRVERSLPFDALVSALQSGDVATVTATDPPGR